jgi:hypothetical protein
MISHDRNWTQTRKRESPLDASECMGIRRLQLMEERRGAASTNHSSDPENQNTASHAICIGTNAEMSASS